MKMRAKRCRYGRTRFIFGAAKPRVLPTKKLLNLLMTKTKVPYEK